MPPPMSARFWRPTRNNYRDEIMEYLGCPRNHHQGLDRRPAATFHSREGVAKVRRAGPIDAVLEGRVPCSGTLLIGTWHSCGTTVKTADLFHVRVRMDTIQGFNRTI